MFKNLFAYRLGEGSTLPPLDEALDLLQPQAFTPCGATQAISIGFVPPRGQGHDPLIEVVSGHWLLRVRSEQRLLPASVVRERMQEQAARIEQESGRKPGKRQLRELKDEVLLTLLPQAFTKTTHHWLWIDAHAGFVLLDCAAAAKADALVSLLVAALPGVVVRPVQTAQTPAACMTAWLLDGVPPAGLSIDRDCELKSSDALRATVRYARHALDTEDVRAHLQAGKRPTRLALTWRSRVSFVLTEMLQIKSLQWVEGVLDGAESASTPAADRFDADAALTVLELSPLLPALVEALGGEAPLA